MTKKMHAAFVERFGTPLVTMEVDVPTPGPGQILVKTEACGVCHTDLHAATGDWPLKPKLPFIPGHEAIGRIAAVGAGVTIVKEGDRVGVPWATGRVDLKWSHERDGPLHLCWTETGGPAVPAPTRKGFGGRIIERMIAQQKGKTHFDWRVEGLVCEITLQP
jgi:NADPH:quinone reductase-like Zn-dependent oxidoreductase